MRYVRARRLTEAARALVSGAPGILAAALDARYGSHEAFTRAFGEQFDLTPEAIRKQGHLAGRELRSPAAPTTGPVFVTQSWPRLVNTSTFRERHREQQVQLLKKRAAKLGLQILEPDAA